MRFPTFHENLMNYTIKPLLAAVFICSVMFSPSTVKASDHLDAPSLTGNGQQDINDLYAFQSNIADNSVLILTVNPNAGRSSPTTFGTDTAYRFEVDTNGDAFSNITYEASFLAAVGPAQNQAYSLTRTNNDTGASQLIATGVTGTNANVTSGNSAGTVLAGTFDDPFFFDNTGDGLDSFANQNVSAIVLEIESTDFGAESIGVWGTTTINGEQIDRVGRPAINTVLISTDELKEAFNVGTPDNDFNDFGAEVSENIAGLSDQDNADALTSILLPDILTFDTTDPNGFLNGRRLENDVIDASLALLTGNPDASDFIGENDVPFNTVFPFLATAQAVPEPSGALAIAVAFGTCLVRRRRKS